jgi:hypothetical protein
VILAIEMTMLKRIGFTGRIYTIVASFLYTDSFAVKFFPLAGLAVHPWHLDQQDNI